MTTKEIIDVSNLSLSARELAREDSTPNEFAASLEEKGLFQDSVAFRAHELPVKSAIGWAAACVSELRAPPGKSDTEDALTPVEQWLKLPNDGLRWQARETAEKSGISGASDVLAMAVFFSGGSISPPGAPDTPPPAYSANKLAAGSITIAVLSQIPEKSSERFKRALQLRPVN